jgi:hypothetical protein
MSTISQILEKLRIPVPKNYISHRPQGGIKLSYISWINYCQLLDQRAGLGCWQWEIKNVYTTDLHLILVGKLSLLGSDKIIVFEATGEEKLKCSSFGDPSSNAEAMALRRACCKAGLSRELWMK